MKKIDTETQSKKQQHSEEIEHKYVSGIKSLPLLPGAVKKVGTEAGAGAKAGAP